MENPWVVYALLSAFFLATSDALTKKIVTDEDAYLVGWFRLIFTLPILIPFSLFIPFPHLDSKFYFSLIAAIPLEIITVFLYIKAIKISPLNLTLPFLSLTPLFLTVVSYIIVKEKVSFEGLIGIILIVLGSYTLNLEKTRSSLIEPFKTILREKGSVLMLIVAFIYSFTSSLGKVAIEHSSPLFFGITYFLVLTILSAPFGLGMGRKNLKDFISKRTYWKLSIPGFFYALMIVFHVLAMDLTKVAYMISVKRLSLIIGVIYGYLLFKEEKFRQRLIGAIIMLIGFVILVNAD